MASLVYLDNSNFWLAAKTAIQERDPRLVPYPDYKHLLKILAMGEPPKVAKAYGSEGPGRVEWRFLTEAGFEVFVFDRDPDNTEKEVDSALVTDMVTDALTIYEPGDLVVLVAGDRDYVPAIKRLKQEGVDVYVAFWRHQNSHELQMAAARFVCLDDHFHDLCKPRFSKNYRRSLQPDQAFDPRQVGP